MAMLNKPEVVTVLVIQFFIVLHEFYGEKIL